jgi:hypothetical protein
MGRGHAGVVGRTVLGMGEKCRCADVYLGGSRGPHPQDGPARRRTCGGSPGSGCGRGEILPLDEFLIRGCTVASGLRREAP